VVAILQALGFQFLRHGRGDHDIYVRRTSQRAYTVTVDMGENEFDAFLLQSMIKQAGVSRATFYNATPPTARKIGK